MQVTLDGSISDYKAHFHCRCSFCSAITEVWRSIWFWIEALWKETDANRHRHERDVGLIESIIEPALQSKDLFSISKHSQTLDGTEHRLVFQQDFKEPYYILQWCANVKVIILNLTILATLLHTLMTGNSRTSKVTFRPIKIQLPNKIHTYKLIFQEVLVMFQCKDNITCFTFSALCWKEREKKATCHVWYGDISITLWLFTFLPQDYDSLQEEIFAFFLLQPKIFSKRTRSTKYIQGFHFNSLTCSGLTRLYQSLKE